MSTKTEYILSLRLEKAVTESDSGAMTFSTITDSHIGTYEALDRALARFGVLLRLEEDTTEGE